MNCKKCGSPLVEGDQFCKNCGEAVNSQVSNIGVQPTMSAPTNNNLNVQSTMNTPNNINFNTQPTMSTPTNNNLNAQPVNNPQPNYSNNMNNNVPQGLTNYNNPPMYNNQPVNKPSGNGKYIIIGLAIVVGLVVIVLVVNMLMNKGGNNDVPNGGGNPNLAQPSTSNYKVNFKGFTFEIPDNFVYAEKSNALMISNEEGTWATIIELEKGSFSQLKANKNQLQSLMQRSGYTASIASEKNLGGVEFITLEVNMSGQNAIAALAKANSMYFIGVTAINQDNEFDYNLLETIAPILKSAKYTGDATNNINGNSQIDMSAISELAK